MSNVVGVVLVSLCLVCDCVLFTTLHERMYMFVCLIRFHNAVAALAGVCGWLQHAAAADPLADALDAHNTQNQCARKQDVDITPH